MKVAFQGEPGAYSEEAIIHHWREKAQPIPRPYLLDVFETVERGEADVGLVAVENSIEGSVVRTFDLLNERSLRAQGETVLRVLHCLIVNHGVKESAIRRVFSHPQALGQSRDYLERHGYEPVSFYDTAGSVRHIRDNKLMDAAAIASARAAAVYDMDILVRGLENHSENYTRFLIVGKDQPKPTGRDKTSIAFIVAHRPGALFNALGALAENGINMMKIESRPLIGSPWEYIFFIDFEGHVEDEKVVKAMDELRGHTKYMKHLGSYPSAQ